MLVGLSIAQLTLASEPRLKRIMPRGVQRGERHVLTLVGQRLNDAEEVFFYDEGFSVVDLKTTKGNRLKVTVDVAADCRLGEHVAQVRTRTGISDFRIFQVEAYPAIKEQEPNNDKSKAQTIKAQQYSREFPQGVGAVIAGVVTDEDADWFRVDGKQGERLSIEVVGMRLGEFCDTTLKLLNPAGEELASVDDTNLTGSDPFLSLELPVDGEYLLCVSDAVGRGGAQHHYRLHIGNFPRPSIAIPATLRPGKESQIQFLNDGLGPFEQTLSIDDHDLYQGGLLVTDSLGTTPSPIPVQLVDFDLIREIEPNNNQKLATVLPAIPCVGRGTIDSEKDNDFFSFEAKKGEFLVLETFGYRIGSPIDTRVAVRFANEKTFQANGDSDGSDSSIRMRIPEDGTYFVLVRDELKRGGPDFRYELQIKRVRPSFTLNIPPFQQYTQLRQFAAVHQGNRFAVLLNAKRDEFNGPIDLQPLDPACGLTLTAPVMRAGVSSIPVVFEAAAQPPPLEAKPPIEATEDKNSTTQSVSLDPDKAAEEAEDQTDQHEANQKPETSGQLVRLLGVSAPADAKTQVTGAFANRTPMMRVQPGNMVFKHCKVDRLAVGVLAPVPYRIELEPPQSPLAQNGRMKLKVNILRDSDFKEPVTLRIPYRAPGVNAHQQVVAKPDQDQVEYEISTNDKATIGTWPICVTGSANHHGTTVVSSKLEQLEVIAPFVAIESKLATGVAGETLKIECSLDILNEFDGDATIELAGLPSGTTFSPATFNANDDSLTLTIATTPKTPSGKNHWVSCNVSVQQNGQTIVFRAGSVSLRVSKAAAPESLAK